MFWLTQRSLRYPKLTLFVLLVITAALGAGTSRVKSEYGYRVLLGDDHPSIRILDEFIERYGGGLPIIIAWDYNGLAWRDSLNGNPPVEVVVPSTGVVAGVYVQAISAFAPHPNAAKLWMEYLYSDEGQLTWLKGYCHPIRFNDLAQKGLVPKELLDKLPPAAAYEKAVFPSLDAVNANSEAVKAGWDKVVGADVVK